MDLTLFRSDMEATPTALSGLPRTLRAADP